MNRVLFKRYCLAVFSQVLVAEVAFARWEMMFVPSRNLTSPHLAHTAGASSPFLGTVVRRLLQGIAQCLLMPVTLDAYGVPHG